MGPLVDQHVVVEGHVVDLVVGRKRKGLRTDFHADGLPLGLGVNVPFVVENPIVGLVSIERNHILSLPIGAVDFLQKIVPRVVAVVGVVISVPIVILEGRQIVVLANAVVAMRGVLSEICRHGVALGKVFFGRALGLGVKPLTVSLSVHSLRDEKPVVIAAHFVTDLSGTIGGQRPRPEVILPVATVHGGRNFQLLVGADPTNPQGSRKHGRHPTFFGHEVGSAERRTLVPQRSPIFDEGLDVVPLQIAQGRRRSAPTIPQLRLGHRLDLVARHGLGPEGCRLALGERGSYKKEQPEQAEMNGCGGNARDCRKSSLHGGRFSNRRLQFAINPGRRYEAEVDPSPPRGAKGRDTRSNLLAPSTPCRPMQSCNGALGWCAPRHFLLLI